MRVPPSGERWLVVTEEEVLPADTGGRVDHRGLVHAALAAGIAVRLLVPTKEALDLGVYAAAFPGVPVAPLPRDPRRRLHVGRLPYVVSSRALPASVLGGQVAAARVAGGWGATAVVCWSVRSAAVGTALASALGLPLLVRCLNLDSQYFRDLATGARGPRRVAYRLEAARLAAYERRLDRGSTVSAFADISAIEARAHRTRTAQCVLHVPTFALEAAPPVLGGVAARRGVLFLGSLDVETNRQALGLLLGDVWPLVLAAVPDARLQVVGRRPTDALRATVAGLAGAGVTLHEDVPDVAPFLAEAAVAVNPVLTGAGVNVKLVQAMAAGCACVSTPAGVAGLPLEAGRDLLVATGAEAFAGAVAVLLTDASLRASVAAAGVLAVTAALDPGAALAAITAALHGDRDRSAQAAQSER